MKGYKLTGRGWALAVAFAVLIAFGAYTLVSFAFGGDNGNGYPSPVPPDGPGLEGSQTPGPTDSVPPEIPPVTGTPPDTSPRPVPTDANGNGGTPLPEPEPSPPPIHWSDDSAAVMFLFNSAEMAEPVQYSNDLEDMLPPVNELEGYLVMVTSYTALDEDLENLAGKRAEAVYNMLLNLGVPAHMIRTHPDTMPTGTERYRQRADIYFLYVGDK
jgi:outer membrane protein OmpA-like peptidoglycan-associated protein